MNFFKILKQGCFWKFCTWKSEAAPLLKEKASPNAKIAIKQKLSENIKKLPQNPERRSVMRELYARYREYENMTEAEKEKLSDDWDAAEEYSQFMSKTQKKAEAHHKALKKTGGHEITPEEKQK